MEMIENYMVMPREEYKTQTDEEYEVELEEADREYEDRIFERLVSE